MFILKTLLAGLLIAGGLLQGPSVSWKAQVTPDSTLVLTGQIAEGCFVHPLGDQPSSMSLEIEGLDSLAPDAEYTPADYKGESVAVGRFRIRQSLRGLSGPSAGTVSWVACSGDNCYAREEFDFRIILPGAGVHESAAPKEEPKDSKGLLGLILEAILWGLAMLLTPCVFPMVPMTVSFFLKQSGSARQGRIKAALYGLFIVLLYTVPIAAIIALTRLFGGDAVTADIFNWLSTHWLPNIVFFLVFMVFAASFFGAFELVLPASWTTKADAQSSKGGILGVFFLALTLVLVSFSCTGPIVGTVLIKSTRGEFWTPMVTMLAFSTAFALPFALLAAVPKALEWLPKSGGWLGSVKIVLGFVELALGLKFLSVADQTYHWHILDREVYLAIWIVIFTLLGLYLLGKIHFRNDTPPEHIGLTRLTLAIAVFSFVVYLIPGMWGAPLKALSGYLPPLQTQDFVISGERGECSQIPMPHGLTAYDNLEDGLAQAKATGKNVFVDITGLGCVNCREMEARVWSDPAVLEKLRGYVMVALYNDDKTTLPESRWIRTPSGKVLKDAGRVNSYICKERFGVNAQPNYIILSPDGEIISGPRGYNLDIQGFLDFLK